MASYKQTNSWREDGYGEVTVMFVISDTYEGLFLSATEANIFELEDVKRSIKQNVGGSIETELNLTIDEAKVKTSTEIAALNFVKAAMDISVVRFVGIYVNTGSSVDPNKELFTGVLQPEFEGEDLIWSGSDYDTAISPITRWSVQAKPYSEVAFDAVAMSDLIDGISESWISTNVADRIGFFSWSTSQLRQIYHNQLVSLDKILRELADQMETHLSSNGLGNINIVFDESPLDGRWHPARWNHKEYTRGGSTKYPRFVEIKSLLTGVSDSKSAFQVYNDDYNTLKINPDGSSSSTEQVWLSWRLFVKQTDEPFEEPQPKTSEEYMATRYDSFFEFLEALAFNFGCFLKTYWSDTSTLHIKFQSRQSVSVAQIYLKSAAPTPKRKISPDLQDTNQHIAYSNYLAMSGAKLCYKVKHLDGTFHYNKIGDFDDKSEDKKLFLTISPTVAVIDYGEDDNSGWIMDQIGLPLNCSWKNNGAWVGDSKKFFATTACLHTAIYLYVEKRSGADKEPNNYYTPAAKISFEHEDETYQYDTLIEYLSFLNGIDEQSSYIEYNIDVPYYYGFSANSDGSSPDWRVLDVGKKIVLDGVDYAIVEAKWSVNEPNVSLVLQGVARYDIEDNLGGSFVILQPSLPGDGIHDIETVKNDDIIALEAATAITAGNIVSLKDDGTVEIAYAHSSHYGRFYGVAISDAAIGETVEIKRYGEYYNADYSFTPGQVFIRNIAGEDFNLSQTILQWKAGTEDMVVKAANAIDANTITFDFRNQPRQLILEVEMT